MIFVSSSVFKSASIAECLDNLITAGINNIELSGGTEFRSNVLDILKDYKERHSLNLLIHNYFPPPEEDFILNIASFDESSRCRSIDFVKGSINLAADLGIDRYSVHAGYTKNLAPPDDSGYFAEVDSMSISKEHAMDIMFESLAEIEKCARRKIKIGVENLFPIDKANNCSLMCTPDEIFFFLEKYKEDDMVDILLDLGHLFISSEYLGFDKDDFIETLIDKHHHKVMGIHLSGTDGKTDQHGALSSDCWQVKASQRFNLEKIPVTIECRGLDINGLKEQFRMITNILGNDN